MTFYIFHRHRICLVDHVDLICSCTAAGKVLDLLPQPHCPWVSIVILFPPLHVGRLLRFAPEAAPEDWVCSCEGQCRGGATTWAAGVLAAPGTQGGWELGRQEIQCSEGDGNQYWPVRSSVLSRRNPLPNREAWKTTVYRVTERWTLSK